MSPRGVFILYFNVSQAADVEPDLKTYNLLISKLMANGDHIKARQATILRKTHSSLDDNSNIKRDERNNVSNSSISMSSTEVCSI